MTRKIKFIIATLFVTGLLFLFPSHKAYADDAPSVTLTSQPISDTPTSIVDTSTVTVQTVQTKIDAAVSSLQSTSQASGDAIISAIQANVPNTDINAAISIATTQQPIATAVADATAKIQVAQQIIDSATVAVQIAQSAIAAVNTQTSIVDSATVVVESAQTNIIETTSQVESQTVVVATDNTNVVSAQATVESSTIQTTTNGITATVYNGSGLSPALPAPDTTPILTTTVPQISFNWGNGSVLGGPSDRVIVKFEGTITVPQEAVAVKYAVSSDDGSLMYIDGQLAISNWRDQGTSWSPYSPTYNTTTDKQQDFVIWYYENGGGASCTLGWLIWRADGTGYFTTPQANAFGTTITTTDPAAIEALSAAQQALTSDTADLNTLQQNLTIANENLTIAQQNLTTEQQNLTISQETSQASIQTADSIANNALVAVQDANVATGNAVTVTQDYYAKIAADKAAAEAALAAQQAANEKAAADKAQADAALSTLLAQQAAQAQAAHDAEIAAQQAANAKAEADAKAAQDAADKAAQDKLIADQKAAEAKAAADKAQADALAAQQAADAKAAQDKADADAKVQAAKDAQAAADAAKAEADAKAKAESDAKLEAQKAADEAAKKAQEEANAKAAADAAKAEADKLAAQQAADKKAAEDKAIADKAAVATIGVVPNNPSQLSDTVIKEAPKEALIPHIQQDKVGVENGGIEFFGTKSAPQVVGEDGKLTPPAPLPGSGLPIPADAITTKDTFIGQPGGTTFNAPDIAVPVIETPLPATLASVPGAQALNHAFVAMSNIGNDMSPVTRKKAKKILVATLVVAAIRRRFGK